MKDLINYLKSGDEEKIKDLLFEAGKKYCQFVVNTTEVLGQKMSFESSAKRNFRLRAMKKQTEALGNKDLKKFFSVGMIYALEFEGQKFLMALDQLIEETEDEFQDFGIIEHVLEIRNNIAQVEEIGGEEALSNIMSNVEEIFHIMVPNAVSVLEESAAEAEEISQAFGLMMSEVKEVLAANKDDMEGTLMEVLDVVKISLPAVLQDIVMEDVLPEIDDLIMALEGIIPVDEDREDLTKLILTVSDILQGVEENGILKTMGEILGLHEEMTEMAFRVFVSNFVLPAINDLVNLLDPIIENEQDAEYIGRTIHLLREVLENSKALGVKRTLDITSTMAGALVDVSLAAMINKFVLPNIEMAPMVLGFVLNEKDMADVQIVLDKAKEVLENARRRGVERTVMEIIPVMQEAVETAFPIALDMFVLPRLDMLEMMLEEVLIQEDMDSVRVVLDKIRKVVTDARENGIQATVMCSALLVDEVLETAFPIVVDQIILPKFQEIGLLVLSAMQNEQDFSDMRDALVGLEEVLKSARENGIQRTILSSAFALGQVAETALPIIVDQVILPLLDNAPNFIGLFMKDMEEDDMVEVHRILGELRGVLESVREKEIEEIAKSLAPIVEDVAKLATKIDQSAVIKMISPVKEITDETIDQIGE